MFKVGDLVRVVCPKETERQSFYTVFREGRIGIIVGKEFGRGSGYHVQTQEDDDVLWLHHFEMEKLA